MTIVASVQFEPDVLDVRKNLSHASELVLEAAYKGAKIIVLPELSFCGSTLMSRQEASEVCQVSSGYQTQQFVKIVQKTGCYVAFGYVELFESNFYNSAQVIGPRGMLGNVRKHNLEGNDLLWCEPDDGVFPVISIPGGRLGVLVGADSANNHVGSFEYYKPHERFYSSGSIDVLCLLASIKGDYAYPDVRWFELGKQLDTNVVVANRVGKDRDLTYKGGSAIIDRDGNIYTYGSNFDGDAIVGGRMSW